MHWNNPVSGILLPDTTLANVGTGIKCSKKPLGIMYSNINSGQLLASRNIFQVLMNALPTVFEANFSFKIATNVVFFQFFYFTITPTDVMIPNLQLLYNRHRKSIWPIGFDMFSWLNYLKFFKTSNFYSFHH